VSSDHELAAYPSLDGSSLSARAARESSPQARIVFVAVAGVVGAGLALPAAWLWSKVANPPHASLTPDGVFFGESQLNQLVGVTLWFLLIGAAFGFVAGALVGWYGRRFGVLTVVAVLVLSVVATYLSSRLGIHMFGPDEREQAKAAAVGDSITSSLEVASAIGYLGWPIGSMVGVVAAMLAWPDKQN